jgi:hypothetical protein
MGVVLSCFHLSGGFLPAEIPTSLYELRGTGAEAAEAGFWG